MTPKEQMNDLYALIEHHANLYYNEDNPEISDAEYDDLVKQLKEFEKEHPEFVKPDFLTHRVGGQALFSKVKHAVPMLSLDNVFDEDELSGFFSRLLSATSSGYTCELKIDGLAVSLIYEDGIFVRGATRGNGHIGEDVTANLLQIESLPKHLKAAPKGTVEVRGEVLMKKDRFERINALKEERGESIFANPRNAAAGTLRQKEQDVVKERGLDIFLYYLVDAPKYGVKSQFEALQWLEAHGLPTQKAVSFCPSLSEVNEFIADWHERRNTLDYVTDGVVIKLDDLTQWDSIGSTSHAPRWAVAYKYPPEEKETRLLNIEISIGRTGILTPVAVFEPVRLAGTQVERASLHNADEIQRKDIRIGDLVRVRKAAEIIPEVVGSNKLRRTGTEKVFTMPERCPVCGAEVIRVDAAHRCVNRASCPAQLKESLKYFASRDGMDIKGLGDSLAEKLINANKVKTITDIYKLRASDLLQLEKVKEKTANNIMAGIEASKKRPVVNVITALGIPDVGKSMAQMLVNHFGSLDAMMGASETKVASIEGVGDVIAHSVCEFFRENKSLIKELKELGLNTEQTSPDVIKVSDVLSGKTFVFTGTLTSMSRDEASHKAQQLGAKVGSSISAKTDYLVAGDKAGSKLQKAEKLGIKILTEQEFLDLVV